MRKDYQEIVEEIFGSQYKHKTLRTVFDPQSYECNDTTIETKMEILKKILDSKKITLENLIFQYKSFYTTELTNKGHFIDSLENALIILLKNTITA